MEQRLFQSVLETGLRWEFGVLKGRRENLHIDIFK